MTATPAMPAASASAPVSAPASADASADASLDLPSFDDVEAAARRIEGQAHRTPVLTSRTVDERLGARVFFKCENFQRMGAFKFRGAFNALSRFTPEQRRRGVVAFSSGNHAQAIALSARLLGMPSTIVMPKDAPAAKIAATRGYGGEVVLHDRYTEDRQQIGRREMQSHTEHQQDYAHLGQLSGKGGVGDKARRSGADQHARYEVADERGQAYAAGTDTADGGECECGRDIQ